MYKSKNQFVYLVLFLILLSLSLNSVVAQSELSLTSEEQAWLDEHPTIIHAPDPDYAPYEFFDTETQDTKGLATDYLDLVAEKIGITIERSHSNSWAETLDNVKAKKADLVTVAAETEERSEYVLFTDPYISIPDLIIVREGVININSLSDLSGKTLVTMEGWAANDFIREKNPEIIIKFVPDITTALSQVSLGQADATVLSLGTAGSEIKKNKITNLKIAGETGYVYDLTFASRKDWPMLNQILDKTIKSLSKEEVDQINKKWFALDAAEEKSLLTILDQNIIYIIIGLIIFGVIIFLIVFRNRLHGEKFEETLKVRTYSLRKKIILISLILVILVALVGVFSVYTTNKMSDAVNRGQSHVELAKNANQMMISLILVVIIVYLVVLFFMSSSMTKPIKKLYQAAKEFENRNFRIKVDIKSGDELEELGEIFNKISVTLDNMDKEHKQLDEAKTRFLSITSHELRSPMTPIRAQLQMLSTGYYGKIPGKQQESINIVLRNADRLDKIIVDFLDVSRIEAARLKFKFVKTDLSKIVKIVTKAEQDFMKEKKIKIINNVKNLPIIQVDPDRFSQILQNLINNAIKFSSENGKIEVNAIKKNNILEFSVSDKGIGLNPGDAAKIFEPFFQAEQSIYREQGGSGLGLAICRGIVLAQGGGMWVESKKGKGSTFYFTIPLKPVKEIKPIRLLFSKQENVEEKLKELFKNILGPIGDKEFELLKSENELVEDKLSAYVNLLVKKGILEEEKGNNFKDEIYLVIGTRLTKTRNTYSGF